MYAIGLWWFLISFNFSFFSSTEFYFVFFSEWKELNNKNVEAIKDHYNLWSCWYLDRVLSKTKNINNEMTYWFSIELIFLPLKQQCLAFNRFLSVSPQSRLNNSFVATLLVLISSNFLSSDQRGNQAATEQKRTLKA